MKPWLITAAVAALGSAPVIGLGATIKKVAPSTGSHSGASQGNLASLVDSSSFFQLSSPSSNQQAGDLGNFEEDIGTFSASTFGGAGGPLGQGYGLPQVVASGRGTVTPPANIVTVRGNTPGISSVINQVSNSNSEVSGLPADGTHPNSLGPVPTPAAVPLPASAVAGALLLGTGFARRRSSSM